MSESSNTWTTRSEKRSPRNFSGACDPPGDRRRLKINLHFKKSNPFSFWAGLISAHQANLERALACAQRYMMNVAAGGGVGPGEQVCCNTPGQGGEARCYCLCRQSICL